MFVCTCERMLLIVFLEILDALRASESLRSVFSIRFFFFQNNSSSHRNVSNRIKQNRRRKKIEKEREKLKKIHICMWQWIWEKAHAHHNPQIQPKDGTNGKNLALSSIQHTQNRDRKKQQKRNWKKRNRVGNWRKKKHSLTHEPSYVFLKRWTKTTEKNNTATIQKQK